jgi:hypothetical protein
MGTAAKERNRAFVLKAFDTLASRGDDAAAQRFWSGDCSQHSTTSRRAETVSPTWPESKSGLPSIRETFPTQA